MDASETEKQEKKGKSLKNDTLKKKHSDAHTGTVCCVCQKSASAARTYYGHKFCIKCFHKYIWSPSRESAGDIMKSMNELFAEK